MHIDARTLDDGAVLEGDICIVGAGAAGISMALEWIDTPYRVLLLEGGGFEVETEMQDLYDGETTGQRYFPLQSSRLHYFGGTTGHWAGFCAPFDALDFEPRPWVPHSGWPLRRADLDPFYARAQPLLELGPYNYDAAYWEDPDAGLVRMPLDADRVWTKIWQFSPPTRFGTHYRDAIVNAPNIHLYTHANVCNIEANEPAAQVERLDVRTLTGKTHAVRARCYVLACGAIQNARLLLASNGQAPAGLGNDHDLVGRYFTEHLEVNSAYLLMPAPGPMQLYLLNFFETPARGELALTASLQEELRISNGTVSLLPRTLTEGTPAWIDQFTDDARESIQRWDAMERAYKAGTLAKTDPSRYREYLLFTRLEQAPNPDSRVTLSSERDALGVPRAHLHWQLSDLDHRSIRAMYEVLGHEMGRTGLGRVQLMDWLRGDDPAWPSILGGGWHHMCTTRMSEDPRTGVVDADGKVHGISNLYVAGSATFATGGAANPTLTLVALTLRLSDHLKRRLG
jgi:choline dehydrogenase-like flavoprotein